MGTLTLQLDAEPRTDPSPKLIAFFEVCSHPRHSTQRVTSSMMMLDSLIRYMNLMTIDVEDTRAIRWPEGVPPIVPHPRRTSTTSQSAPTSDVCSCRDQTLGRHWPLAATTVPPWILTPAWPDGLPESEIQKEECRRLVWSSIQLFASYNSYSVARRTQVVDFALCKASNVSPIYASPLAPQLNLWDPSTPSSFPGRLPLVHVQEIPSGIYTSEQ